MGIISFAALDNPEFKLSATTDAMSELKIFRYKVIWPITRPVTDIYIALPPSFGGPETRYVSFASFASEDWQ